MILARRQFDLIRFDWRTLFILLMLMPMLGALFAMVNKEDALVGRSGTIAQIEADLTSEIEEGGLVLDEKIDYLPSVDAELLLSMMALALTQAGTFSAAYEIVKERAIFKRERAVNLKVTSYVFSKMFILAMFSLFQVGAFMLVIAAKVDMGFKGAIFSIGFVELFISLYLAVLASIAFGLFISSIVPSQDVVLYAILAQLFVQIVLSGTMFPLENNPASLAAPGYWATLSCRIDCRYPRSERRRPLLFGARNSEHADRREGIESDLQRGKTGSSSCPTNTPKRMWCIPGSACWRIW